MLTQNQIEKTVALGPSSRNNSVGSTFEEGKGKELLEIEIVREGGESASENWSFLLPSSVSRYPRPCVTYQILADYHCAKHIANIKVHNVPE